MNVKQELEIIQSQLDNLSQEKTLIRVIDVFQKVKDFNSKLGIDESTLTAFLSETDQELILSADKDGKEIENGYIGLVFKKYDIESVSTACFMEGLAIKKRCTMITVHNDMSLDDFMNNYMASEYNSRYLHRKMISELDNTSEEKNKTRKLKI